MEATPLWVHFGRPDFGIDNSFMYSATVGHPVYQPFLRCPAAPVVLLNLGNCTSANVMPSRTARRNLFFFINGAFEVAHEQDTRNIHQAGPCFPGVVLFLLMVRWWGTTYLHLIHWNLHSRLGHTPKLILYKMPMLWLYKMLFRDPFYRGLAWPSIKCPSRAPYFIIL